MTERDRRWSLCGLLVAIAANLHALVTRDLFGVYTSIAVCAAVGAIVLLSRP